MALLDVRSVQKLYGQRGIKTKALDRISFSVDKGEFVAIMGPSGSGKTTLLNCISTIERVSSGHILVEGTDVTRLRGKQLNTFRRLSLGFIFQELNLLDNLTAFENIALALSIRKMEAEEIRRRVNEIADVLEISDIMEKFPVQLSGGQQQRVAAARAIVTEPTLILADEPTGALDSGASRNLLETFSTLNQELQTTMLMVTHDPFAASYAGRILFIKDGKIFNELRRGADARKDFFENIIKVQTVLGGDQSFVL